MVLPFGMGGHANRDLHRCQYTLLHGICRALSTSCAKHAWLAGMLAGKAFLGYYLKPKEKVMDSRTLLILGIGIIALLVLGFYSLPA
ncbi:hypothetical protein EJ074_27850 [Mesorhizobium sp. M3A.F.Ca.ET.080.04.2.1]|nr:MULTISPECIES: hypothetical protein [unclassified Mesorhizobium]AZO12509.1 hypothetical protein EJ074_27850 [Mesorhizobium sp. M3A.F.Ca.ET.080.04.2.1]RWE23782.1 MAG: hypothetical protein EOS41_19580 [Mesorhizobium sp.]TGS84828.1 hypothetical protein EN818_22410 [Mesorhizobium sp. M3A.F.Ca.ET.175.01.1.1]